MMHRPRRQHLPARSAGFSLLEMIMVIVITGIIASVIAVFMSGPLESYISANRRADLTDTADLALRRLSREIRQALPNSLKVTAGASDYTIEFIATSGGGSYLPNAALYGASPSFSLTVSSQMPSNPPIAVNDYIVINNMGGGGYYDAEACSVLAYCNAMQVTAIAGQQLTLAPLNGAPAFESPGPSTTRFQVVPGGTRKLTFTCPKATSAFGALRRSYGGFGQSSGSSLIANNVRCDVKYPPSLQTFGILVVTLTLTDRAGEETVTLMREIHIDNAL